MVGVKLNIGYTWRMRNVPCEVPKTKQLAASFFDQYLQIEATYSIRLGS